MPRKPLPVPNTPEYMHAFMILGSKTKALRLVEMYPKANWKEINDLAKQYLSEEKAQRAILKTPDQTAILSKNGITRRDWQDFFFASRNLALIGLPHRQTKEIQISRSIPLNAHTVGNVTLTAMGATKMGVPLPFGMNDRGVISVCTTMAVRNQSRVVELDYIVDIYRLLMESPSSAATVMKKRKLPGGSQYRMINESVRRLAYCGCMMQLGDGATDWTDIRPLLGAAKLPSMAMALNFGGGEELLMPDEFPLTSKPKNFRVILDEKLYEVLRTNAIPYPVDYLKEFTDETIYWDLAHFLPARIQAAQSTSSIPLTSLSENGFSLREQLGSDDSNPYRFRKSVEEALLRIKALWPHCTAEIQGFNLVVHPITPDKWLVPPKDADSYVLRRAMSEHELSVAEGAVIDSQPL